DASAARTAHGDERESHGPKRRRERCSTKGGVPDRLIEGAAVAELRPSPARVSEVGVVERHRRAALLAPRSDHTGDVGGAGFEAVRGARPAGDVPDAGGEPGVLWGGSVARQGTLRERGPQAQVVRRSRACLRGRPTDGEDLVTYDFRTRSGDRGDGWLRRRELGGHVGGLIDRDRASFSGWVRTRSPTPEHRVARRGGVDGDDG